MTETDILDPEPDEDLVDETESDDTGLYETKPSSLPYFGADFDAAGLVRRLNDEDIVIPRFDPDEATGLTVEGFQRQRVWTTPRMEKFIESLLLGWPVPSVFLVVEPDGRYLVLDGQQRLTTLQSFYNGKLPDGRDFELHDVAEHLHGATYETLSDESKRRLNNTFIQAVVIEPTGEDGRDAVYRLFGRLNSGGVSLTPQEIRVALYRGPFVNQIRSLNHDANWRTLFGPPHKKLKDHEMILRSFAMASVIEAIDGSWDDGQLRLTAYKPPMAQLLNDHLESRNNSSTQDWEEVGEAFARACAILVEAHGKDGLRFADRLNAAHIDAVMGALIYGYKVGKRATADSVKQGIAKLRADKDYLGWISRSTSHRDGVYGRLQAATNALLE